MRLAIFSIFSRMKLLFFLVFTPLWLTAQESISYSSPLTEYISENTVFEEIDRTITIQDSTITILSRDKGTTDIQTWKVIEKVKQDSDFLFRCLSKDMQYPVFFMVYDYESKVERIEVFHHPSEDKGLIRFHID
ncbi:hypothetical protein V6B16_01290 [Salinimicrobium catena]|uniref:hypothetical protein n=1 Tax=Salinimicrobium catena TaxID=390640 RepID=UPI002FE48570